MIFGAQEAKSVKKQFYCQEKFSSENFSIFFGLNIENSIMKTKPLAVHLKMSLELLHKLFCTSICIKIELHFETVAMKCI